MVEGRVDLIPSLARVLICLVRVSVPGVSWAVRYLDKLRWRAVPGTGPVTTIVNSTVISSVSSVVIVIYSPVSETMNNTCCPNGQIGEKPSNM